MGFLEKNNNENKIDEETVEQDWQKFCEEWDIDTNEDEMDEEERNGFKNLRRQIKRSMKKGRLVYNAGDESFTYKFVKPIEGHGEDGQKINFHRPAGTAYLAIDKYKDNQSSHKLQGIIAICMKKPPKFVSNFDGIDLKVFAGIINLFLSS